MTFWLIKVDFFQFLFLRIFWRGLEERVRFR